MSCVASPAVP
ncbi:hypothetical protein D018_4247A, partial [Vibrio parahaemolyticus VP2007-007]